MSTLALKQVLASSDGYAVTSPVAVAASGDRIVIIGYRALYASKKGGAFKRIGPKQRLPKHLAKHDTGLLGFDAALFVEDDEIWTCGFAGVARSRDFGASFEVLVTPKAGGTFGLNAIVRARDGAVWAAGDHGNLFVSKGSKLTRVKGLDTNPVLAAAAGELGVVFVNGVGRLYIAENGKVRATKLYTRHALHGVCITTQQTIVAVGEDRGSAGAIWRSTDRGASFSRAELPRTPGVYAIASLADGRLVAGADEGTLLVSNDDGATFQRLASRGRGAPKRGAMAYGVACSYGDGAVIGGRAHGLFIAR
jgi:photosystem II stability/assembly factor-like uncharacterized protein